MNRRYPIPCWPTLRVMAFCVAVATPLATVHAAGVEFKDAWVRAAPPNAATLAGYLTIKNGTNKDLTIVAATSPDFEKLEFHQTLMVNGMARMEQLVHINVARSGEFRFAPNGNHIMLISPKHPIKQGEAVTINFIYADGGKQVVKFPVKKQSDEEPKGAANEKSNTPAASMPTMNGMPGMDHNHMH